MKLGVVILNYNDAIRAEKLALKVCGFSVVEKVVIVDNCSIDNSREYLLPMHEKMEVIYSDKNGGFSYGNNFGAKYMVEKYNPEYILFCNPDTDFLESNILSCIEILKSNPVYGLASTRMLNIGDGKQEWYYLYPKLGTYWQDILLPTVFISLLNRFKKKKTMLDNELPCIQEVATVRGSWMLYKCKALIDVGYFDDNVFMYWEESIMGCRLMEKGYKTVVLNDLYYTHNHPSNNDQNKKYIARKLKCESLLYYWRTYRKMGKLKEALMCTIIRVSLMEWKTTYNVQEKIKQFKETSK